MAIREVAEYLKLREKTAYLQCGQRQDPRLQGRRDLAVPAQRDRQLDQAAVRWAEEMGSQVVPGSNADVGVRRLLSGLPRNPVNGFQAVRSRKRPEHLAQNAPARRGGGIQNGLIAVWSELTRQAAAIYDTRGDLQGLLGF